VAVQDCGLVVNPRLAESVVYGAIIMGIVPLSMKSALWTSRRAVC